MKISLKWLSNYVEVQEFFAAPEKLEELLTSAGLEVEGIENMAEALSKVVIGKIVELGKHPDADKLTVCKIDVGSGENQQIICGAKNHKQGDHVVVALPGANLPGDFSIKKSKIRGVESHGMLCSLQELGLVESADGIEILPSTAAIGTSYVDYAGLEDIVFDISITPNRADCLSHIGVAREVATLLDRELKIPVVDFSSERGESEKLATVDLVANDMCLRYCGRGVVNVKVGPSPTWLKQAVESIGMNSINNIVDVTNYVMMETGQPLHAFDADQIAGKKITIDLSKSGEMFTALDGTELKLTGSELMIRDGEQPVALAGIVGGLNSGVTEDTSNIFLEAAHFTTQAVRKTARKFKVDTESGFRFARGTDPEAVVRVMNRACQLIQKVAGGDVCKTHIDSYPTPVVRKNIKVSLRYLSDRLGYDPDGPSMVKWFAKLGAQIVSESNGVYEVKPPFYRWDLLDDVDLVEEYARLNGYDKIPDHFPELVHRPTEHDLSYMQAEVLADVACAEGYSQAINYNFLGDKFQEEFMKGSSASLASLGVPGDSSKAVRILNPLSDETNVMRVALAATLFKNLLHNYRHGNQYGRLFEVGNVFAGKSEGSGDEYLQTQRIGLLAWGQEESLWRKESSREVVYDIKGAVENIMARLQATSFQWRSVATDSAPGFIHPGQLSSLFYEGKCVGYIGSLHPAIRSEHKIRHDVAFAELDLVSIMRGQPRKPKLSELSKFPAVERDIAFLVPDEISSVDLTREIKKMAGRVLASVEVFDIYRGKGVEEGYSSTAFRMVYSDPSKTLGEEELTSLQEKVIKGLTKKFGISVR